MPTASRKRKVQDDYLELIYRFPLAEIRTQSDYAAAIKMIDELSIIDDRRLTPGQADYLYVLSELVETYEHKQHQIDLSALSGIEMLKFLLDENDMTASDLGRLLGNRQLGAVILRGERELSKAHIRKLSERFSVGAELFLS